MRIAICIPHYGDVKARFAASLAVLAATTTNKRISVGATISSPEIVLFFEESGASIELKRTRLVTRALDWGADYLQWIDTDHEFPGDGTLRLVSHDKAIIGCNYPARLTGRPTALDLGGNALVTTAAKAKAQVVESVSAIGFGFCLVKAEALHKMARPLFASVITDAGEMPLGEDVHFCNQARAAGLPVYVDHGLSNQIGHIAERILSFGGANADTVLPSTGTQ